MYIPKHFEITNSEEMYSFIEKNSFGQLISSLEGRLFSSHIPFLVSDDRCRLIGHLAKQNPQWESIDGQEVLVTLQGPHDYISPSWYSSPGVPTWNYQAVHVYGRCLAFHGSEKLKAVVDTLTKKYEASFEKPWQPHYAAAMLKGIVGLEIEITEVQCQYKLSQNRSKEDRAEVIRQLGERGSEQLSRAMADNRSKEQD